MDKSIYRKKSLEKITSPESLSDYLHVTSPAVWLILVAVILLLAGMLIWSSVASIDSFVTGTAQVEDGSMHILLDDEQFASVIQPGMLVKVGESECRILSIGTGPSGTTFATAETPLADGSYSARIILRQTQVLRLLFN